MEFILKLLVYLLRFLCIFVSISFFTLLEEKLICLSHICNGPSYVRIGGVLQPFRYALGLLSRIILISNKINLIVFIFSPLLRLIFSILLWSCLPFIRIHILINKRFFFFLIVIGLRVFPILMTGWGSNNKYSTIGRLRGVSQIISYELCFSFFLLSIVFLLKRLRIKYFLVNLIYLGIILIFPLFSLVFIMLLAESNRRPFDFAESPSELVRGFITEYRGVGFVVLFMREYLTIIFISILFIIFFIFIDYLFFGIIIRLVCFSYIWVRVTVIRLRYDVLINLNWKYFLLRIIFIYIYIRGGSLYYI